MKKLTIKRTRFGLPEKNGLYDPAQEKDACGVGFITHVYGERSHKIIHDGILILKNLEHRGASGGDPKAGDGAGLLSQLPHDFFQKALESEDFNLPDEGDYGVGMLFLPPDIKSIGIIQKLLNDIIVQEKQALLGWRRVPTDNSCLSKNMLHMEPVVYQIFIKRATFDLDTFERKLYVIRRLIEKAVVENRDIKNHDFFYICSLSAFTIVYKGMFLAWQLDDYFTDLKDENFKSALALVHQRYSTNTFPTWGLAQPFRYIAHNGEINTLKGNINWTKSRENIFESNYFGADIKKLLPIIIPQGSDSASFDNFFECLVQTGRSLAHSLLMMMPEAWENKKGMDKDLRGFYEYHSSLMEPWDGPAAMMFSDGIRIGGGLDRNGLRPIRYTETTDGYLIMASEMGVLDIPIEKIRKKGRLGPGKILMVDTDEGRIYNNNEIKKELSTKQTYARWVEENKLSLDDLPAPGTSSQPSHHNLRLRQRIFAYSYEELQRLVKPMATTGVEPTSSMGNDAPLAVLSDHAKPFYSYFKQHFAQVTNPPIDPIREEVVMSLGSSIGGSLNIMEETASNCRMLDIPHPILTNSELSQLKNLNTALFRSTTIDMAFSLKDKTLKEAINDLCHLAEDAVDQGFRLLVLSDRKVERDIAPIPAILAVSAVHHYLIRIGKRGKIGLIVETGEAREVHHFAMLIGYGAGAINPYLIFESITQMEMSSELQGLDYQQAGQNYIKAVQKGLKKIFSKMGISTLASYQGSQIFEAVGLNEEVIEEYFPGTHSVVSGIGLDVLEEEIRKRHDRAYAPEASTFHKLLTTGDYSWRSQGEYHGYNPDTIHKLQLATRKNDYRLFKEFSYLTDTADGEYLQNLRDLFSFNYDQCTPIPLEEVEPVEHIFKRFCTGAMSIGSISKEVHETIAIAMNRIGGKSNSGEGGEDPARFTKDKNGDLRRSAIKQVASGRFGVTSYYLVNADELQIKIAQGAKPGEGGQLPGFKVNDYIAKIRNTIPGVTLISPPPHHDIYSIEDIAQLIFDLKNANPQAAINVKLVSETGVGTVAAGVSKAKADVVTIAGHDGGTGASPATSIKHAGLPWEIGLAETQQTLVKNSLRGQIRVQVDGQIKTGRDVVIGALLGADEFGFATSALIVMGCIMMRKCHLNTCPVGIATQDAHLRKNFTGEAEFLVNFFHFVAEEVREYMARFGFRKFEDMIGKVELLNTNRSIKHWKAKGLNFSKLFATQKSWQNARHNTHKQSHHIDNVLDQELIRRSRIAIEGGERVEFNQSIKNKNRTTGTLLGSLISTKHGVKGLPEDTIKIHFKGTAGQSFGAFIPRGLTLTLSGDANDYVGKGLSGGKIIIAPPEGIIYKASENMIIGNTSLYGATSGEAYFAGLGGERFAVRNSGVTAVIEGV
jgi:glutamate synthase domain-containing protein 2/glutamate synthase domain-containing protein 1